MIKNEMIFYYLEDYYEQLIFEYNKPKLISPDKLYREEPQQLYEELIPDCGQNAIFVAKIKAKLRARSQLSRVSKTVSALAWHLKLAHAGPDVIEHLENAALGVIINRKGLSTIECKT